MISNLKHCFSLYPLQISHRQYYYYYLNIYISKPWYLKMEWKPLFKSNVHHQRQLKKKRDHFKKAFNIFVNYCHCGICVIWPFGSFICEVWMFSLCLCGLSPGHSHFLPQSKDVLVGDSKLAVGVTVSTNGCVSLCAGPAIEWQPVKDAAFQFVAGGMAFSPLIRNWG